MCIRDRHTIDVPQPYEITGWDLRVESWTPGETVSRTETLPGSTLTTTEYAVTTKKTDINVQLDTLTTWDNIPEVGKAVSGKGYYSASFNWDGSADGAYLDFGDLTESMQVFINGKKTADVSMITPVVDISDLLVTGENTIEIIYSSNLTNVQLSRGVIREGVTVGSFKGYEISYKSYGPHSATILPYMNEEIPVFLVQSASAPQSAPVNSDFAVTVVTHSSVKDVRLFNASGMGIGRKAVSVTENEDGTKTWSITVSLGTVGNGRTLTIATEDASGLLTPSDIAVSLDITSIPPVLSSCLLYTSHRPGGPYRLPTLPC